MSGNSDTGPLRRLSSYSAATSTSPPPNVPKSPKKISLNQYQVRGLECLQEQVILMNLYICASLGH